ncbi:carbonic anhydrase [Galbitalea sp. SE-J8]|uniref:carbonic anhydrase n=1 Tax=Galbitalea sp. SE-J8 TaxID=3054952 RepID=UPI00259CBEEA|nr:carbonic anhydrase [Galbitalea sp. SE-J8]MDM4763389.1 carbonic anhydrase [Galbitalea sp. SE-J8]
MLDGNARFIAGSPEHPHQDADYREALAGGQTPSAALFGCADSRLAAEIIFDRGLGDLFVVRNAGQVVDESVIGSLEYAVTVLGVALIVVLGHDSCGAVAAAIASAGADSEPLPPHIAHLTERIQPAVMRVALAAGTADRPEEADAFDVGREHLRDSIAGILSGSEIISERVAAGTLAVVGANYRLAEGRAVPDVHVGLV